MFSRLLTLLLFFSSNLGAIVQPSSLHLTTLSSTIDLSLFMIHIFGIIIFSDGVVTLQIVMNCIFANGNTGIAMTVQCNLVPVTYIYILYKKRKFANTIHFSVSSAIQFCKVKMIFKSDIIFSAESF